MVYRKWKWSLVVDEIVQLELVALGRLRLDTHVTSLADELARPFQVPSCFLQT